MKQVVVYLSVASHCIALAFAIAALYLGSISSCSDGIDGAKWLIAVGSLELIFVMLLACMSCLRCCHVDVGNAVIVSDGVYAIVRLILIGIGVAALECRETFGPTVALLVFQGLCFVRATLLCFWFIQSLMELRREQKS